MNGKIKHYQREALKTRLASADPFEVTQMLMEGALESMKIAKINVEMKDLENKSKFIAKATTIIIFLKSQFVFLFENKITPTKYK